MNKTLSIAVAIITGLILLIDYFVPNPLLDAAGQKILEGIMVLGVFALFLGILNLMAVHLRRIQKEAKERGLSVVLLLALVATFVIGVVWPSTGALGWVFDNVYFPLQSSMAALLAFMIITVAFRALNLRSVHSTILLISSIVMLLAQLPFSASISPLMPLMRDWLIAVPITAAMRGILLGTALGTIATSLRILMAVDKPYAAE